MAEEFLFAILRKIASLALDEVALAWGLEADLKKLQELLNSVRAVLLDANEKPTQSRQLRLWLGRLESFCYDANVVLDDLEYECLREKVVKQYGNAQIKARRFFSNSNPLVFRYKMAHRVKELRERISEIADHRSKFHLGEHVDPGQAGPRSREMTDSLLCMSNVIGRDGDKEYILRFLLHLKEGETVSVIPIVGLGGMGKTTLAKMLYNDVGVKEHFHLRIWVCVSEIFEKKQIMVSMIKSLTLQNRSDLDPDQLQRLIQENLNSKRFLLVLDDVWSDDRMKWIEFQELLLGGAAGSKVIVTTRSDSVADTVRTVPSYHLNILSHEKCLSLFEKMAFREGEEKSHPHLMKRGEDIVKRCGGIPLAVKRMGTLLYSKMDESFWKFIRDSETLKLDQKENETLPALNSSTSNDKASTHLRFLNLSGSDNIKRLPDSTWKLHHLLSLDLSGCLELEELSRDIRNLINLRHLEITTKQKRLPDDGIGCLRSLQFLYIWNCSNLEYLFEDIQNLTSLRSLFVSDCRNFISLPRNLICLNALEDLEIRISDQFNWTEEYDNQDLRLSLRYLALEELPQVVTLPQWLQKSSGTLQCIKIHNCKSFLFPEWFQEFTSLENIEIFECPKLVSLPEGMHRLTSLEKLWIRGCPVLSERYKRLEDKDWQKIAHVPNIEIDGHAYADIEASCLYGYKSFVNCFMLG